jgi:transcriptional regulator with XRE-family HTH domain
VLSDHPFAERVHRLRDEAGLTQYDLAREAEIRPEMVSRIENGRVIDPPISIVIGLAKVFTARLERQVTVGYVAGVENGEAADEQVPAKAAG